MLPTTALPVIQASSPELFSDSRKHGYDGPIRNVHLLRATSSGGGSLAKSEDGVRCVVAGKESLRILRMSEASQNIGMLEHKAAVGRGGHRIDASRNFWEGSGLKIDSASTDVAWGYGTFGNKILTSARNGELIMWDLNKSGLTKYERRSKDHMRSIHKLSYSHIVHYYCITGSADGDLRVWDLRDMKHSVMRIHHPTSIRSVVFSPVISQPLQAVVGLDNGSIYRWDLQMGQRGQLDRLPVAHSGPILGLDWCNGNAPIGAGAVTPSLSEPSGFLSSNSGAGWIASGGLDRCVKVWDLTRPGPSAHIPHKPSYILHPSFPVRRVLWRPSYECELAVVSNADFGTGSNQDISAADSNTHGREKIDKNNATGRGDFVEIWDVRREWLPKWSVSGSAVEGGVTDIAFGDSHALWAQHTSGTFSQLDVRRSIKPIDAINRVALSWEVSGSLAFVADKPSQWEAPYDDIAPETKFTSLDQKIGIKTIGDGTSVPQTQSLGNFSVDYSEEDMQIFHKLARGYIFEGQDRQSICSFNAEIALDAGKEQAAQAWLLMGSLLTDLVPGPSSTPPPPPQATNQSPAFPHSTSAPAAIPTVYSFPPRSTPGLANSSERIAQQINTQISPGHASKRSHDSGYNPGHLATPSTSSFTPSRKITPSSSASSSPQHVTVTLPPTNTPIDSPSALRQSTALPRRESALGRRPSMTRKSSVLMASFHEAARDGFRSHSSARNYGEGALDDSDSSSEGGSSREYEGSEEESELKPSISPYPNSRLMPVTPSPLSRVAGQHLWSDDEDSKDAEDDDDEASLSPDSTDSDTSDSASDSPRRIPRSQRPGPSSRRESNRNKGKGRSRSSTVASLAASSPLLTRKPLIKQDSQSSIRTVTAGDTSIRDGDSYSYREGVGSRLHKDETLRDLRRRSIDANVPSSPSSPASWTHRRHKSQALSTRSDFIITAEAREAMGGGDQGIGNDGLSTPSPERQERMSDRKKEMINTAEAGFREMGWRVLRETLNLFSDEGDVQMCTLLSLVAPRELRISKGRMTRFLEAYIELLSRLRLHTSAAYLRKNCQMGVIRNKTRLETIVYTTCGGCRKPIVTSAFPQTEDSGASGNFSYCRHCQTQSSRCSICNLPVRSLFFQCSVCAHGGHQDCYRRYYMHRPMIEMCVPILQPAEIRGRSTARSSSVSGGGGGGGSSDDESVATDIITESSGPAGNPPQRSRKVMGHPCAAGCGHFCWAAVESVYDI